MKIRPLAICLIERGQELFVLQGYDSVKDETFYRPVGGGIEFGERAVETAKREFKEELGAEINILPGQHVFENIFSFDGKAGHEIIFCLNAEFVDPYFYRQDEIVGDAEGTPFLAKWINRDEFISGQKILYPKGLAELLI